MFNIEYGGVRSLISRKLRSELGKSLAKILGTYPTLINQVLPKVSILTFNKISGSESDVAVGCVCSAADGPAGGCH